MNEDQNSEILRSLAAIHERLELIDTFLAVEVQAKAPCADTLYATTWAHCQVCNAEYLGHHQCGDRFTKIYGDKWPAAQRMNESRDDNDWFLRSLFPAPVGPQPVEPVPFEVTWINVEDVGHESDAFYQFGWRCISRHGKYALLCRERTEGALLDFMIMVGRVE